MLFSVWNELNVCLPRDETEEWAQRLGLVTVPVLYRGIWDEDAPRLVIRSSQTAAGSRKVMWFGWLPHLHMTTLKALLLFVRKNHVQTDEHWLSKLIEPNRLVSRGIDDG